MREISGRDALEVGTLGRRTLWVFVCVVVCYGGRGREREDEGLKVTDVSSLTMRNMISSLPVIQMYRP